MPCMCQFRLFVFHSYLWLCLFDPIFLIDRAIGRWSHRKVHEQKWCSVPGAPSSQLRARSWGFHQQHTRHNGHHRQAHHHGDHHHSVAVFIRKGVQPFTKEPSIFNRRHTSTTRKSPAYSTVDTRENPFYIIVDTRRRLLVLLR